MAFTRSSRRRIMQTLTTMGARGIVADDDGLYEGVLELRIHGINNTSPAIFPNRYTFKSSAAARYARQTRAPGEALRL
jgi:hypothetical protein